MLRLTIPAMASLPPPPPPPLIRRARRLGPCLVLLLLAALPPAPGQEAHRVYVEDSPGATSAMARAARQLEDRAYEEAARRYHTILEEHGEKLVALEKDRMYRSIRIHVRKKLASDPALLAAYQARYARRAAHALEQAPSAAGYAAVARDYPVTQAGLTASLHLAAWHLERAMPVEALSVLETAADHPALEGAPAEQWRRLRTIARTLEKAAAGRSADPPPGFQALDPPPAEDPLDAHRPLPALNPETIERTRLWTRDLTEERVFAASHQRPLPASTAIVHGGHLVIHTGYGVLALDRYAGRLAWRYKLPFNPEQAALDLHRDRGAGGAPARMIVQAGRLITVLGSRRFRHVGLRAQQPDTELVALGTGGELLWRVKPETLDPTLRGAAFLGAPVSGSGRVIVMARRSQAWGQDLYIVAVNTADGTLAWRRHLSSATTGRRRSAVPQPPPSVSGPDLYVRDGLGTVARLDQRTGAVHWLRLPGDEEAQIVEAGARRHADSPPIPPPVLTEAGLVVTSDAMNRPGRLIDPKNGAVRRALHDQNLATAQWLLRTGDGLLAVGSGAALYDPADLSVRWHHTQLPGLQALPTGRPIVSGPHLLVAGESSLLFIRLEDGRPRDPLPTGISGHPLTDGEALFVVSDETVRAWMPFEMAYERLTTQSRDHPDDPRPGLALASIGQALEKPAIIEEGAALATEALARRMPDQAADEPEPEQAMVFEALLDLAADLEGEAAGHIIDRAASIAHGPGQEVAFRFTRTAWLLGREEARKAVDLLQSILATPELAREEVRGRDGVLRLASLEAGLRLEHIAERQGEAVTAHLDKEARQTLDRLLRQPGNATTALVDLARQYPLAGAGAEALYRAAGRAWEAGRPGEALMLLDRAFEHRGAPDAQTGTPGIAERAMRYLLELDRPHAARAWLDRLAGRGAGEEALAPWRQRLAARTAPGTGRTITLTSGTPHEVPGRLLAPARHTPPAPRTLLTLEAKTLRFFSGFPLTRRWQRPLENPAGAGLLAVTDHALLLRLAGPDRVVALRRSDGRPAWPAVELGQVLASIDPAVPDRGPDERIARLMGARMNRVRRQLGLRDAPEAQPEPPQVLLGDHHLFLVDPEGRIAALDRRDGTLRWRRAVELDRVGHLALAENRLLVGGHVVTGADVNSGVVWSIDTRTGRDRHPAIELTDAVSWVGTGPGGLLLALTPKEIAAYDPKTVGQRWRISLEIERPVMNQRPPTARYHPDPGTLLVRDAGGGLRVIDPARGKPLAHHGSLITDQAPLRARPTPSGWVILGQRAVRLGGDGRMQWRDALGEHRLDRLHLDVHHERALMISHPRAEAEKANGLNYRLDLLELEGGAILASRRLEGLARPLEPLSLRLTHRIALTDGRTTWLIPTGP